MAKNGNLAMTVDLIKADAGLDPKDKEGTTALHLAAERGNPRVLAVLIKAGADLNPKDTTSGATPLLLAAERGQSDVMAALIEAGANVDTCNNNGASPFFLAARNGHIDPVRELLRANASPLLSIVVETGEHFVPLDVASYNDSEVVRALIQQRGIIACAGESGGVDALTVVAAQKGHAEIVGMLVDAGVVDTGKALIAAARWGGGVVVTFLLQQRKLAGSPPGLAGYVNFCDDVGSTPLFGSIDAYPDYEGMPGQVSPRVVRLLLDAGADTSSSVHVTDTSGGAVLFSGTSLAFTTGCLLREKKRRCKKKAPSGTCTGWRRPAACCCGWKQCVPSLGCG